MSNIENMQHWARVANEVMASSDKALQRAMADDEPPVAAIVGNMAILAEIVADLARQQAKVFKAINQAHEEIE